jgi:[ribosomal protein S5]-alanine N-acetyltransferase
MNAKLVAALQIPYSEPFPACETFRLAPWQVNDVPAVMAASADPEIHAFTSMPDPHEDAALAWITQQPQQRRNGLSIHFALRDRQGRILGNTGFVGFEWSHRRAEVGYWVLPQFRRRGIASQALDLVTGWAFDRLPVDRIDLFIDPGNQASKLVAQQRGYAHEARLRSFRVYRGGSCDLDLYGRLRPTPPPPPHFGARRQAALWKTTWRTCSEPHRLAEPLSSVATRHNFASTRLPIRWTGASLPIRCCTHVDRAARIRSPFGIAR